ncbi:DUF7093 family protein [Halopenitus persicus]|uniref:DUF7093 family protein n=1 Tax=Halopenitus persicus TaxID=1048396 RepID=UPI000BBAAA78|nr:hypothetical protein [Halopenitus persicus]
MGLRCLLGHDFGEPELEREREEEGEQVVVTVREVKRCDRCGESQIVSENTEVTSLDRLTEEADRVDREETPADAGAGDAVETPRSGRNDEPDAAVTVDEEETAGSPTESSTGVGTGSTADDAEIIGTTTRDTAAGTETDVANADAIEPSENSPTDDHGITVEGDGSAEVDVDPDAGGGEPPIADPIETTSSDEDPGDAGPDDGAELIGADEPDDDPDGGTSAADETPGATATRSDASTDDPDAADGVTDDGVILDADAGDTGEAPTRKHGEWPAEDSARTSADESSIEGTNGAETSETPDAAGETRSGASGDASGEDANGTAADLHTGHGEWPEQRGEDEGFNANPDPDAGDPVESAVSFEGGLTPEADDPADYEEATDVLDRSAGADAAVVSGPPDEGGGSIDVEDPGITAVREADVAAEPEESATEYFCPECDLVQPAGRSSMRAGDICPECKRGYIAERPTSKSA